MNTLRLPGAEVHLIQVAHGTLRILLASAMERSAGQAEAGVRSAELVFTETSWRGSLSACRGTITDAAIAVAGSPLACIPVPFTAGGGISAELLFASGAVLVISAETMVSAWFRPSDGGEEALH